ncbi:MAG: TolC family protein [Bdellovibrionales bacterium]|nr:TolC family protein [Bdellovibrionales bacterium]
MSIGKEETQNVLPGNISEALSQKSIDREDEEDRIKESRSLQALDLLMQAGHKKVEVRHSDLFPELNAILGFSFDDSTRFSTSADRQQMYVGFNFSMPLGNKKTKAQKQSVQYETMQAELAKIDFERDLRSKIKTLHIEMDNIDRRIKLAESKLNLSRKIVKEEQRRYKNGQISIETLINSIQSELEHELNVVTLSVERSKKSIQWMQVTDRLVVKNNQIDL